MTYRSWQVSSSPGEDIGQSGLILKNIKYTKTRHGRAIWTLSADQAEHDQATGVTRGNNIRLVFIDRERGDIVLTADRGQIFSSNETIIVTGHVRIENRPDNILLTDSLEYDENTGILKTGSPVYAVMDDSNVHGRGMIVNTRQRKLQILSDVNATLDQESR
jgi:LPS export ABC transporter protein LptC